MFSFPIWNFLDAKTIALGALALITAYFYYENRNLNDEIEILSLKNLHLQSEVEGAKSSLLKQNEALKALQIATQDKDLKDAKAFEKLENLQSDFQSCEAELKAFKELFDILSKANR